MSEKPAREVFGGILDGDSPDLRKKKMELEKENVYLNMQFFLLTILNKFKKTTQKIKPDKQRLLDIVKEYANSELKASSPYPQFFDGIIEELLGNIETALRDTSRLQNSLPEPMLTTAREIGTYLS